MKEMMWVLSIVALCTVAFLIVLKSNMNAVDNFCSEMKAGLDVRKIASVADKYDVGLKNIHDPKSVDSETLGSKVKDSADVWFFEVAPSMTVGEHSCGVYHNNKVVLSAKISR